MRWLFKKITDISDAEYSAIYSTLSPSRKAHIDAMPNHDDKQRSLLATALINELLKEQKITGATLETDADKRPFLRGSEYFVSISHRKKGVAAAISKDPVGIDVEIIKPIKKNLIKYVCTESELKYVLNDFDSALETVTDADILKRFFEVFTSKEACYKRQKCKDMLKIETLPLEKQHFIIGDFLITIT